MRRSRVVLRGFCGGVWWSLFAVGEFLEGLVFGVDLGVAVDAEGGGEFGGDIFFGFFGGDF